MGGLDGGVERVAGVAGGGLSEVAARGLTADGETLRVLAAEDAVLITSRYVHVWWTIT